MDRYRREPVRDKDALRLAIDGSPIPVLNHLAHQTGMCGLAVCDLSPLVAFAVMMKKTA
ncbi:MAG: hypothetical protein IPI28_07345 [Candidatus Omnitrophica bacterium]|nr:hypothetical protein [Candidatus Omnitrophota bacterium]